jgi:predicted CoA-binding protein
MGNMITLEQINEFLAPRKMIVAGVSRDSKKFSNSIYRDLKKNGFEVYPFNPNADEVEGEACYKKLRNIPGGNKSLYIVAPKSQCFNIVKEAIDSGIEKIWIQQMSETKEAIDLARANNIELIHGKCMYMFLEPVESIHRFHRGLVKFFGRYPKSALHN